MERREWKGDYRGGREISYSSRLLDFSGWLLFCVGVGLVRLL